MTQEMQLSDLVVTNSPEKVMEEIRIIISLGFDEFDFNTLDNVFNDVLKLYNGDYPGYRKCTTEYHSLSHTIDTFIAMARLINGYIIDNHRISEKSALLGLISALMHDTGYIQTNDDNVGTGAKYTLVHISRSITFLEKYFEIHGYSREDTGFCTNCIWCTNINIKMNELCFSSREEEVMGKMLGIADLISQIADRSYLEKLIYLYMEFIEGKVEGFQNEVDMLNKTVGFFDTTIRRFVEELGNLNRHMINHFNVRWNINSDLYMKAIENNVKYLEYIMMNKRDRIQDYLRRDGIIDHLSERGLLHFSN